MLFELGAMDFKEIVKRNCKLYPSDFVLHMHQRYTYKMSVKDFRYFLLIDIGLRLKD